MCRAGLERHPGYLSARVTLGRALMEIGQLDDAELEFDLVLGSAPDNLAAIRGIAEINQRRGDLETALGYYQTALGLARHDPDLEETVAQISRALSDTRKEPGPGLSFEQAQAELLSAAARMPFASGESQAAQDIGAAPFAAAPAEAPSSVDESPAAPAASPGAADASPLFDFDQLLEALGQPAETPAPPHVEVWLSGAASPAPPPPNVADDPAASVPSLPPPTEPPADDILGQIEEDLRRLEAAAPSPDASVPTAPPAPDLTPGERAALDELERWLDVLEDARRSSGASGAA